MELDIDVLVDDSPVNIAGARDRGMVAATLVHPWNQELVDAGDDGRDRCGRLARAGAPAGSVPGIIARQMPDSARTPLSLRERPAEDDGGRSGLPSLRGDDLRRHLPGVEPDRTLTDWGRSERVERVLDQTVVDFLYRYWFRAEVEGIENVPAAGGALLVSNHAGALPPDATMIVQGHP